jgi:hypothetical protein
LSDPLEKVGRSLTLEPKFSVSKAAKDATGSTHSSFKTSLSEFRGMGILAYRLLAEPVRRDIRKGTVTYNRTVGAYQYLEVFIYTFVGIDVLLLNPQQGLLLLPGLDPIAKHYMAVV